MDRRSLDTQRNVTMDVAKGIAIILVIFDHINTNEVLWSINNSFYMAFFFLISGYFFKDESFKTICTKRGKRLLLPYVEFGVIAILFLSVKERFVLRNSLREVIANIGMRILCMLVGYRTYVIYFLLVLFNVSIMFAVLYKTLYKREYKKLFWCVILLLCVMGYIMILKFAFVPWYIHSACLMLVFYALGWLYGRLENRISRGVKIFGALIFAGIWIWGLRTGITMSLGFNIFVQFPLCHFIAVAGCAVFMLFSYILGQVVFVRQFLAFCGRNTLKILCINNILIQATDWAQLLKTDSLSVLFLSQLAFSVICCLIWCHEERIIQSYRSRSKKVEL